MSRILLLLSALSTALLADLGLWVLFGMQHSGMARWRFKRRLEGSLPGPWRAFRGLVPVEPSFVTPLFYRIVRHPIQLGVLVMMWGTATMRADRLVMALRPPLD